MEYFHYFCFTANVKKTNVLAALLFSVDQNGILVNWLAVSKDVYAKKDYGERATGESFQRSGFGKFLLLLAQLCSSSLGWNTNIFLQVNTLSPATHFYSNLGFVKMRSNSVEELPSSWQSQVNKKIGIIFI